MSNKTLLKIAGISGWALLAMLVLYFISGYAMVHRYGMDALMNKSQAWFWHKCLTVPFFVFLALHIAPYYIVRKQVKRLLLISAIVLALPVLGVYAVNELQKQEAKPSETQQERVQKAVACPNCSKGCVIKPGQTGECGKYKNVDGNLRERKIK